MAIKRDPRVDTYIQQAAPFARPILKHLRKLMQQGNPEAGETIKWSCPFYTYHGRPFANFAAFKAHATFGFWHQGMEKVLTKEVGKTDDAMGLLGRITSLDDLPSDKVLLIYIKTAKKLHDTGLPSRPKPKPKPEATVPADLADALRRSKKAATAWTAFTPSCRREYIEWITSAKRPETREERLLTTIEWTAEGKPRHWKYQNC